MLIYYQAGREKIKTQVLKNILRKKSIDALLNDGRKTGLKKTLNALDLFILGIGAVVGTGIYTIIGSAAAGSMETPGAGAAIVISMLMAALAAMFSALSYSEIAAMMPAAGSAYTFTYAAMGEFAAWLSGWILILEYAIGNITVSAAWSGYFVQFLKGFKHLLPDFIVNFPLFLRADYRTILEMCGKYGIDPHDKMPFIQLPFGIEMPFAVNLPSVIIVFLITVLLIKGVKESAKAAGLMVFVNLSIIISFIIFGARYIKPENWTPFAPNGLEGILSGAFIIFFAYIGFDALSTAAEEAKNPQKDLPAAIIGTMIFVTVLYTAIALVLTGMIPLNEIDTQAPLAGAMRLIGQNWYAGAVSAGALCAITSVLLIYQLGTTRIFFAIARDNFFPKSITAIHKKFKTPHVITWLSCAIVITGALFFDLKLSAELCNYAAFTSFIAISAIVLILRKTEPDRFRPFKVPCCPLFPICGIVLCGSFMIYNALSGASSALYFLLWIFLGLLIYIFYGFKNKRKYDEP